MDAIDLLNVLYDWKPRSELPYEAKFAYEGEVFVVVQVNEMACSNCHFYSPDDFICHSFGDLPDCGSCIFVEASL